MRKSKLHQHLSKIILRFPKSIFGHLMGISSWFWLGKMKIWNPRMFSRTEIRKTDHLTLILGTISWSEASSWNEVRPMVLNTVYCWDQIPVKHLCHKLILRNIEWWAPAWHWQPSCHFKSAGLSPVSCFHDFVLIQMAPSVGLSFTRRSQWFLQIYRCVTKIFTCLDSELNYTVI